MDLNIFCKMKFFDDDNQKIKSTGHTVRTCDAQIKRRKT